MSESAQLPAHALASGLGAFLRAQTGRADIEVVDVRRIGGGSSKENWFVELRDQADDDAAPTQLVLRRDSSDGLLASVPRREFDVLKALSATPVRAPRACFLDETGEWLGRPFIVMERLRGVAHRKVLTARGMLAEDVDRRHVLAHDLCEVLADIHRVDITTLPSTVTVAGEANPASQLAYWRRILADYALEPHPLVAMAEWWLRDHLPGNVDQPTLVHGDYRPANVLVEDGQVVGVLDWETAHLGDPAEDLGWYCTPLYRREHFVLPSWDQHAFIAAYEERMGRAVNRDRVRFWSVLAAYKLTVMAIHAAHAFVTGTADRAAASPGQFLAALAESMDG